VAFIAVFGVDRKHGGLHSFYPVRAERNAIERSVLANICMVPEASASAKFRKKMPADRAGSSTRTKQGQAKLRQSLQHDWAAKRFKVEYQPQINLQARKIVRFEALLRWEPAAADVVSPKDFIPLAEDMGMIGEMGQWVLERACADAMRWPEDVGIAVNVTAASLHNAKLPSMVQHALRQSGLAASRLELEVTETSAIVMDTESLEILNALRDLGVRITIDDLDVGHSSLRYLLDFSFDKVKVDGLYAAALGRPDARGTTALEIMRCFAEICRNLNIDCLAEGVENAEQLALVMAANFTEVQGYLFGESVPAEHVDGVFLHVESVWQKLAIPKNGSAAEGFSFFQVADAVNDIIIVTNAEIASPGPVIIYVNPAFTRLTGFTANEVIGKTPRILQGPGSSRATLDGIRAALNEGRAAHEKILNYTKGGAPYWLDMRVEPLRDQAGVITHYVAIERDITLDKRRLDELEYVADRDLLTGIPNRRAFLRALEAEILLCREPSGRPELRRPLCMAWIDVDRFKDVNDSFGHATGDAVLFRIAERLAENMRRIDMIGRLGGEEFAVCMPDMAIADAYHLADRLCHVVAATPIETLAGPVFVTVSIGVAELVVLEDSASLMARADAAMYAAKRAGGNQVCGVAIPNDKADDYAEKLESVKTNGAS
jgi:diguanylate cyclase (GGDEF)-like protein/PAS domain S-box-containing protein